MRRNLQDARFCEGFTLVEVLVALSLLAVTAVVLIDTHYSSMRLFADARDEVIMQSFLQSALGQAEIDVQNGTLSGSGNFGKRYQEFSYTYAAQLMGAESIPLYTVTVQVTGPEDVTKTITQLVYGISEQ
jgi:prepilin-type N-terminal cleavage/methylation domain-containing protein